MRLIQVVCVTVFATLLMRGLREGVKQGVVVTDVVISSDWGATQGRRGIVVIVSATTPGCCCPLSSWPLMVMTLAGRWR